MKTRMQRHGDTYVAVTPAFGATVRIVLRHARRKVAELAIEEALREARMVDALTSIHGTGSQVHRLNREGELTFPDRHLLAVLEQARALSVLTRGAFDITVQPLWQVYRDAPPVTGRPRQADRLKASVKVGWERVEFDARRVAFLRPGMQLTLNGLAKGYAADLALAALRRRGVADALVDTGAYACQGCAPAAIGVADPRQAGMLAARMRLDGRSAATSGDYKAMFTPDFVHHHIFDPATGDSPQDLASATVVAASSVLADGLATAFMVMGARKAHALAATLPGVDLMTINKRGVVWKSPAFPVAA